MAVDGRWIAHNTEMELRAPFFLFALSLDGTIQDKWHWNGHFSNCNWMRKNDEIVANLYNLSDNVVTTIDSSLGIHFGMIGFSSENQRIHYIDCCNQSWNSFTHAEQISFIFVDNYLQNFSVNFTWMKRFISLLPSPNEPTIMRTRRKHLSIDNE